MLSYFNMLPTLYHKFRPTFNCSLHPIPTISYFNRPRHLKHRAGLMTVPKLSGFSYHACNLISPPATSLTGLIFSIWYLLQNYSRTLVKASSHFLRYMTSLISCLFSYKVSMMGHMKFVSRQCVCDHLKAL